MEIRKENQRKPSPKFSTQIGELVMIINLDNEYILDIQVFLTLRFLEKLEERDSRQSILCFQNENRIALAGAANWQL